QVPVYSAEALRAASATEEGAERVEVELAEVLSEDAGIFVISGALTAEVIDRVTADFEEIIATQRREGGATGDHFAPPGANDRGWNALGSPAVAPPEAFVASSAGDLLAPAAPAWLGPGYQGTSRSTSSAPAASRRPCTATTTSASPRR